MEKRESTARSVTLRDSNFGRLQRFAETRLVDLLADKNQLCQAGLVAVPEAIEVHIDALAHGLYHLPQGLVGQCRKTLDAVDIVLREQFMQNRRQAISIDFTEADHERVKMIMRMMVMLAVLMVVIVMIMDIVDTIFSRGLDAQQQFQLHRTVIDISRFHRGGHAPVDH